MIEDPEWTRFLPRAQARHSRAATGESLRGQTVCVSGAAGDIGSALVDALAFESPCKLVLLDSSEHGLFNLQRNMAELHPDIACEYVLGSVCDGQLLNAVFDRLHPQSVFHAAAYKHVGLLECRPFAAIQNNVIGTHTLFSSAREHGASSFVLLSTDKAVNPHSVMGVSKRIAELIAISLSSPLSRARAVRLGNVIGSKGSVVPIFLDQIANGRPVRVTHPNATRYFISKDEAVTTIVRAGASDCHGTILVPQLAAPVLIADLARYLLTVFDPQGRSTLCFTDLLPGEKMREELVGASETVAGIIDTLTVVTGGRLSPDECEESILRLARAVVSRDPRDLLQCLMQLVPEYVPSRSMCEGDRVQ